MYLSYVPRVAYGLLAGKAFVDIQVHEMFDELLGRAGDVVPIGRVKLIVPTHDLLEQLGIVFVVEGRVAT